MLCFYQKKKLFFEEDINREKYILRFLRSLQNQNYDNIEIILVDDFSEDNSIILISY